jgi:hypothetical protein
MMKWLLENWGNGRGEGVRQIQFVAGLFGLVT